MDTTRCSSCGLFTRAAISPPTPARRRLLLASRATGASRPFCLAQGETTGCPVLGSGLNEGETNAWGSLQWFRHHFFFTMLLGLLVWLPTAKSMVIRPISTNKGITIGRTIYTFHSRTTSPLSKGASTFFRFCQRLYSTTRMQILKSTKRETAPKGE